VVVLLLSLGGPSRAWWWSCCYLGGGPATTLRLNPVTPVLVYPANICSTRNPQLVGFDEAWVRDLI